MYRTSSASISTLHLQVKRLGELLNRENRYSGIIPRPRMYEQWLAPQGLRNQVEVAGTLSAQQLAILDQAIKRWTTRSRETRKMCNRVFDTLLFLRSRKLIPATAHSHDAVSLADEHPGSMRKTVSFSGGGGGW